MNARIEPSLNRTKRRIAALIGLVATVSILGVLLFGAGRALQSSRLDRWLPERSGTATVLGKSRNGDEYVVVVRLDVPAASPLEAALIPRDVEGREGLLLARPFDTTVTISRAQWDAIRPGARLRALFHINIRRSAVFVPTLYLDALAPEEATVK